MTVIDSDVVIVGGGIAGCATSLYLAKRGVDVTLCEKGLAGAMASGVNFGGVRQQGRHLAELPLARRSRGLWPRLDEIIGDACEFTASGHLKIARDSADMTELAAYASAAADHGLDLQLLERAELRERFPWLSPSLAGGSLCVEDGQANPRLVGPAFARAARAAGAVIRERCEIIEAGHDGGRFILTAGDGTTIRAAQMLNCAGAWGAALAAQFGETVPLTAMAPQMVVSEPTAYFIEPALGVCNGNLYLRQTPRGNVIFGGGYGIADTQASRATVLPENTHAASATAIGLIPRLAGLPIIRVWTGIEGYISDDIPVIGPSRTRPGLFHAFGFSGHGFQLGPGMGEILGELLTTGKSETPIEAFHIGRFAESATTPSP
ncbi:MAG: FAD-binding oxidoreductase [Alphaproteobacteria bacterium]